MSKTLFRWSPVLAALLLSPALADPAALTREDFMASGDDGIELFVREVRVAEPNPAKPPVILLHGARVPGVASFDLPVEGGSLAADLAREGHRVFIMDARGYGGSTRPEAMNKPPRGEPLVNSDEVVRDIGAVVREVKERAGVARVALLGWATGGHWVGMYASLSPNDVSHVVIYNSLYGGTDGHKSLGRGTRNEDPQRPGEFNAAATGAYRLNTAASLSPSWDRSIPVENKASWRDPKILEAYERAALASDPTSGDRDPPSFRAPSGAMEDSFHLATGRKLWNASAITARVLIIRSGNDFWSRPEDVETLTRDLENAASVETLLLPDTTHYVHLDRAEKGRARFLSETTQFLATAPESRD